MFYVLNKVALFFLKDSVRILGKSSNIKLIVTFNINIVKMAANSINLVKLFSTLSVFIL